MKTNPGSGTGFRKSFRRDPFERARIGLDAQPPETDLKTRVRKKPVLDLRETLVRFRLRKAREVQRHATLVVRKPVDHATHDRIDVLHCGLRHRTSLVISTAAQSGITARRRGGTDLFRAEALENFSFCDEILEVLEGTDQLPRVRPGARDDREIAEVDLDGPVLRKHRLLRDALRLLEGLEPLPTQGPHAHAVEHLLSIAHDVERAPDGRRFELFCAARTDIDVTVDHDADVQLVHARDQPLDFAGVAEGRLHDAQIDETGLRRGNVLTPPQEHDRAFAPESLEDIQITPDTRIATHLKPPSRSTSPKVKQTKNASPDRPEKRFLTNIWFFVKPSASRSMEPGPFCREAPPLQKSPDHPPLPSLLFLTTPAPAYPTFLDSSR